MIRQHIPGLYLFVETVLRVFYGNGYHKLPSIKMPKAIEDATSQLREEELRSIMEELCTELFETTSEVASALTDRVAKKTLCSHPAVQDCASDRAQARATADMVLKSTTVRGSRLCKLDNSFIKLRGPA